MTVVRIGAEYKTTDYCLSCGQSPESGIHVMGTDAHDYVPPYESFSVTPGEPDDEEDDDQDDIEPAGVALCVQDDVVTGINVDATWRALRRPAKSLSEFRSILQGASVTEDIGVIPGGEDFGYFVTDDAADPVAQFDDLNDARAFLSSRAILELWTSAERRVELAESRVRGLEQVIQNLHTYDDEYAGKAKSGWVDAHAELDLTADECEDVNNCRVIAVTSEAGTESAPFWVSPREARCLAAGLLRAACLAEEGVARRARGEVTSEDEDVEDATA